MRFFRIPRVALLLPLVLTTFIPRQAFGNGDLHKVKHIIIVMQENHSFDNYFGALAYAPGSPYHTSLGGCGKVI
jgi:phospholipase C